MIDRIKTPLYDGESYDEMKIGHERYETARRMNPRQWAEAWELNLKTGKPFDDIIDEMIDGVVRVAERETCASAGHETAQEASKYINDPPWEDIKKWALDSGFIDDGYGDPSCNDWDALRRFAYLVAIDATKDGSLALYALRLAVEQSRSALIHQVGDTRECPHCGKYFVPDDETSRLALEAYKLLPHQARTNNEVK